MRYYSSKLSSTFKTHNWTKTWKVSAEVEMLVNRKMHRLTLPVAPHIERGKTHLVCNLIISQRLSLRVPGFIV